MQIDPFILFYSFKSSSESRQVTNFWARSLADQMPMLSHYFSVPVVKIESKQAVKNIHQLSSFSGLQPLHEPSVCNFLVEPKQNQEQLLVLHTV